MRIIFVIISYHHQIKYF